MVKSIRILRKYGLISLFIFLADSPFAQGYLKAREEAEKAFNEYQYEQAVFWAENALSLAEGEMGRETAEYADCMANLGVYMYFNYQYQEGIAKIELACEMKRKLYGENSGEYRSSLSDLGSLYYMNGDFNKARELFEYNVAEWRRSGVENGMDLAYELNKLGLAQTSLGRFRNAEKNLLECRNIFEANGHGKNEECASLLNNLANLYQSWGNHLEAERYYREAVRMFGKTTGKNSADYATGLQNLGNLLSEIGRYEEADKLFSECQTIKDKIFGQNSMEYAVVLNDLAYVQHHLGNYASGERLYQRSLRIKEDLAGIETATYSRTLNNLAVLYMDFGNFRKALKLLEPLVQHAKSKSGEDLMSYLTYGQNLGILYNQLNEKEKALVLFTEILRAYEIALGKESTEYAMMLSNLASIHQSYGKFKYAEPAYLEALSILESLGRQDTQDYITLLYQTGMNYFDMNDFLRAGKYLEKALQSGKSILSGKNPIMENLWINLARLYEKLNEIDKANALYIKGMDKYLEAIENDLSFMSSMEKSAYFDQLKLHMAFYNAFAVTHLVRDPSTIERVFRYNSAMKSAVLRSQRKIRRAVFSSNDTGLVAEFNEWTGLKEYLNKLQLLPETELVSSGINTDSLAERSNALEKDISIKISDDGMGNPEAVDLDGIRKTLSANEVAVDLIRIPFYGSSQTDFDIRYAALIIPSGSALPPEIVIIDNGRDLENELSDQYYQHLFSKTIDTLSYAYFWKSVADKIADYREVYLSRDGIYNILNVNTLYDNISKSYAIDKWNIHLVAGFSDMKAIKSRTAAKMDLDSREISLFGYPDYYFSEVSAFRDEQSGKDVEAASRGRKMEMELHYISDLPGTKKEVESIDQAAKQFGWKSNAYLEKEATESRLKSIDSPAILHLATHGFFDFEEVEKTKSATPVNRSTVLSQPLLRSGIMMAGSAYSLKLVRDNIPFINDFEDGVLNGAEASNLNLENTDLVVLSACLTSVGETRVNDREGYHGMLRAFLAAGAKAVMASCWAIDDKATEELMIRFYRNLHEKGNCASAFRMAQLSTRERHPQPYYWGAFILVE